MQQGSLFAENSGATDFSFAKLFFLAKKSEEYKPKDELWAIAKYYSKRQNDKVYKGFIVQEIITNKEEPQPLINLDDDYLPF